MAYSVLLIVVSLTLATLIAARGRLFSARVLEGQASVGSQGHAPAPPRRPEPTHQNLATFDPSSLDDSPLVAASRSTIFAKRAFDIFLAVLLLIFSAPLLAMIAVAIKLDSPGPVFYRQERVGRFGRPIHVLKFRSMVQNAEAGGAVWATASDPRITAVGAILRQTRLDEIPQAITILRGEMSFVGPRPERPEFVGMLNAQIPHYDQRIRVTPGLTGWAQVNLGYASTVEETRHKLSFDLHYIRNFSLALEVEILCRTVWVALVARTG